MKKIEILAEIDEKRVLIKEIDENGSELEYIITKRFLEEEYEKYKMPAKCPLCNTIMRIKQDKDCFNRNKCCYFCETFFIEGKEERWKSGWRPDESDFKRYNEWRESKKKS